MLIVGIIIYVIGVVVAAILNGYLISILDENYSSDLVLCAIFSLLSWIDALYIVSYIIIIKTINYSNKLKKQNEE
jgi:hypothetical protein